MRYLTTGIVLLAIYSLIPLVALGDFAWQTQFGTGSTYSVAWGDYDDDGDLDMAVGNDLYEQNYLYINNGDGTFTEQAQFGTGNTNSVAWGDYDNDGDLDMAVGNYNQQNYLYVNNGDGTFTEQAQFGTGNTRSVAWGDYDNDGDLDLAVGNYDNQQNYLYVNNGDGTFTGQAQFGTGNTYTVAWGDYDDDIDLDLAVGNYSNQQNYLYINLGDGTFTGQAQFGTRNTVSVAWGDYDNDGDLDLAVGNSGNQWNYLYTNRGDTGFASQPQFGTGYTYSVAWGDHDNDGDLDMAVGNNGQNYLYINNGDGTFTGQGEFGSINTHSVAWGDYDNDGDLDLAVGNSDNQPNYLYINNEDDDDYLSLHLIGHYHDQGSGYSNRDGIGAKVLVYEQGYLGDDDHLLGFREIEANGGSCGQDSIDAEFGLPDDDYVDILVIWPGSDGSHIEECWYSVAKTQFLTLHEGEGIDVDVCLLSFTATAKGEAIAICWSVQTYEGDQILGFNLYRREMGGDYGGGGDGVRTDGHPSLREYDVDTWTKVNDHLITGENPYTYTDSYVESGVAYEYKLEAVLDSSAETLGTTQATAGLPPASFAILALYPNPASDTLTCLLALPSAGAVQLALYDLSGRLVIERRIEVTEPGEMEVLLDVSGLASGVYTMRASMGDVEVSPACGGVAVVVR